VPKRRRFSAGNDGACRLGTRQIEPNATAIPRRWSSSIGGSFLWGLRFSQDGAGAYWIPGMRGV